jgi:hypothetical protein
MVSYDFRIVRPTSSVSTYTRNVSTSWRTANAARFYIAWLPTQRERDFERDPECPPPPQPPARVALKFLYDQQTPSPRFCSPGGLAATARVCSPISFRAHVRPQRLQFKAFLECRGFELGMYPASMQHKPLVMVDPCG